MVVTIVSVPNNECAESIAAHLVDSNLAACINILPHVKSVYRWEGKIEREEELLLVIKTRHSLLEKLIGEVQALHPYQVPEIIALPIVGGADNYLSWALSCINQSELTKPSD
ncbi:divalent-cation tolerance protein CutA, partial [Arthrospira platensis SPKY1]|nr:divalent-cation tolerance protein CutA [Arthrospira platensis SPKY1]